MFSIGEFSKICGLSVKTLRFYHEKGVLVPRRVDAATGYRYYDHGDVEKARIIATLRGLDFSLDEVAEILSRHDDDSDILDHLERRKGEIARAIQRNRDLASTLDRIIRLEREARAAMQGGFRIEEKELQPLLIAGVRLRGKYSDCGQGFARIGRKLGRRIRGKPFCLYYDPEYREDDADLEACFPVSKGPAPEGISVRELAGGRCLSLLHQGEYPQLGRTYARVLTQARERGREVQLPTREVYLKGPGMIFRGNPKKYLTEVQLMLA
jgi:DNA-binding transcriptional MerR regulator